MRKFKGIIMSMYTSKLTILRHFLKILPMIHMPPKFIASAGSDTSIIFYVTNEHFKSKYTPKLEYLVPFSPKIFDEIYMLPKPLAINHRTALAIIHR